ncbi:MAG: hypothetical protein R3F11_09825 [Verrucomicrobiales bacterium]
MAARSISDGRLSRGGARPRHQRRPLWFSTGRATAADALPALDDWAGGLEAIPLRTASTLTLFPPMFAFALGALRISRAGSEAVLGDWSADYRPAETLAAAVERNVFAADAAGAHQPWIWRHHPAAPVVQALPLTQNQTPPNHPSPSRQLAPFEVGFGRFQIGVAGERGSGE